VVEDARFWVQAKGDGDMALAIKVGDAHAVAGVEGQTVGDRDGGRGFGDAAFVGRDGDDHLISSISSTGFLGGGMDQGVDVFDRCFFIGTEHEHYLRLVTHDGIVVCLFSPETRSRAHRLHNG
jgi:aldehyde:ferredoxin oxidoreductase